MRSKLASHRRALACVFAFAFTATLGFLLMKNLNTIFAANLSKFDAGDIMSDGVMSDYTSMNEASIQSFLKSKNSCNDTRLHLVGNKTSSLDMSGTMNWHVSNGHFVCMADESFNGESAAHIIWQAAQDYKINPQVLIVLLQKEQGLVTDTLPRSGQYRAAAGFGCPDTAPCDAEYYGFKNQVRQAAKLFRTVLNGGWTNYPLGRNYIQYNPNAACGGSWVDIKNRATSALYRYTPYQPNAGALAAGWGTCNCGAYGNRNFYAYFTDWFGDTHRNFVSMSNPRYMRLVRNANRIYPYSLELYDTLEKGRVLKFTSKTTAIDGSTCLRTEHNTNNDIMACVRMRDLEDIPLDYEEIPASEQSMIIAKGAQKFHLRSLSIPATFTLPVERKFTKKVKLFDGKVYYITAFDDANSGAAYGIPEEYLSEGYRALNSTEEYKLTKTANRIDPITGNYYDTLGEGRELKFTSKISVNGEWYYRTEHNTTYGINAALPASVLEKLPSYEPLINPREFKLVKDANRINPITGSYYDTLAKGRVLKFTSKIFVNGEWYYRTEHNTTYGINAALPASVLVDASSV
ncbi:hypothetical protein IJJ18_01395 [Candidatus Saccharibacteria bacterium]|nr:hypothetical protein [Candidatus Saccharibacteria bacterium]